MNKTNDNATGGLLWHEATNLAGFYFIITLCGIIVFKQSYVDWNYQPEVMIKDSARVWDGQYFGFVLDFWPVRY